MRLILALPFLLLAACSVEGDGRNNAITLDVDDEALEQTTDDLRNAADDAAGEIGNAVEGAGAAIENEVESLDEIDVDLKVNRNESR